MQKKLLGLLTLSIIFLSLANCRNPISSQPDHETSSSGMGSLSLLLGGQRGRTILPQTPVFQAYSLVFTSGNTNVTIYRYADTFSDPVHLFAGTYELSVTAYTDAERNEPAAWGKEYDIVIDAGTGVTRTVILNPFFPDGAEYGTFVWRISFPGEVTAARMNISPLSENGSAEAEYYFTGAGGATPRNGSVSLVSGFYSVLFTLVKPGFQTLEWLEILHIYQNLVSSYEQDFNIEFFNDNNLTVTFVFNDGITANIERTYTHGDLVMPITPQPRPTRDGYTFGGWYANANFSERWHFSTPLNRSRTLYLRWLSETCSDAEIIGTFRGRVTIHDFVDAGEIILQLFADNTARVQMTSFPGYTILANYFYQPGRLQLSNVTLHATAMGRQAIGSLMGDMPSQMAVPIRLWDLDNRIVLGGDEVTGTLYRNDSFDFSPEIRFTEVTINVDYPNTSWNGSYVLTQVQFMDIARPPLTLIGRMQGSRAIKRAEIASDPTQASSASVQITSHIFNSIDGLNTSLGLVANELALLMSGSHIAETTDNPWRPPAVFTLFMGGSNNFTVRFPNRMDVRMNHGNFTSTSPLISWNAFPGAAGYLVVGLRNSAGSITPIFYHHTVQTSVTTNALPAMNTGDLIIVQVFALDHTGFLDTENRTGALTMETLTIRR